LTKRIKSQFLAVLIFCRKRGFQDFLGLVGGLTEWGQWKWGMGKIVGLLGAPLFVRIRIFRINPKIVIRGVLKIDFSASSQNGSLLPALRSGFFSGFWGKNSPGLVDYRGNSSEEDGFLGVLL
jgi:hypothetical protein